MKPTRLVQTARQTVFNAKSGLATLLASLFLLGGAAAQEGYPEKPIRIVTGNAPGGPADVAARLIGEKLSMTWGKPVVVESVLGAGGSLAAGHVVKAASDGYTLLMSGDAPIVTNISLYKSLPYDPVRDLAPISQVVTTPNVLVIATDMPSKNVQDLVALARAQPGKLTYGHRGIGFSEHLAGEMFKSAAGLDIQTVSYRPGPTLLQDVIAGRVSMCFCNIATVLPLVRDGKLRALAVTSLKRSPFVSDLPTISESGFAGFGVSSWFGLMAPSGTPESILEKLHRETVRILALPDVRAKFATFSMEVIGSSRADFATVIQAQIPQRKRVIESAGIALQ